MRILPVLLALCLPGLAPAAEPFALKDGDRVVLLGNALVEREQLSGWWELALTTRFHGKKVAFRNLGWSGDDVFGTSRAGFGDAALGFRELREHALALKPTVLVVGYGNVEAYEGEAGKEKFRRGLETLLDALAPAKARVVLLSPVAPARMGAPLPDPAGQAANVRLYAGVVREVAAKRGCLYADLTGLLADPGKGADAKTLDGITLTAAGYRDTARAFEKALGLADEPVRLEVGGKPPQDLPPREDMRKFVATGLAPGGYTLTVDGVGTTTDAKDLARGLFVRPSAEERGRVEKLRGLIVAKNRLYFHRWRPQNITYLLGFRKHEQGKNAAEIPRFDPLVEAKEGEIASLARPVALKVALKRNRD